MSIKKILGNSVARISTYFTTLLERLNGADQLENTIKWEGNTPDHVDFGFHAEIEVEAYGKLLVSIVPNTKIFYSMTVSVYKPHENPEEEGELLEFFRWKVSFVGDNLLLSRDNISITETIISEEQWIEILKSLESFLPDDYIVS